MCRSRRIHHPDKQKCDQWSLCAEHHENTKYTMLFTGCAVTGHVYNAENGAALSHRPLISYNCQNLLQRLKINPPTPFLPALHPSPLAQRFQSHSSQERHSTAQLTTQHIRFVHSSHGLPLLKQLAETASVQLCSSH